MWYPLLRFREAGAETSVVGPGPARTHASKHGYEVRVDKFVKDVSAADFDAVIIPGGYAPDRMRRHPAMVALVRQAVQSDKVVAAICHAGWMLASAEVLQGRTVTGFYAIKDDLVHAGAHYRDAEVVVDGNLITSRQARRPAGLLPRHHCRPDRLSALPDPPDSTAPARTGTCHRDRVAAGTMLTLFNFYNII